VPLLTAAVVAYGRAFRFDRGDAAGYYSRLREVFPAWPPLNGPWLQLHETILSLRDELFAHSDKSRRDPVVFLAGDADEHGRIYGEPHAETSGWMLWPNEIPALHHVAASMRQLVLHALARLLGEKVAITEVTGFGGEFMTTGKGWLLAPEGSIFTEAVHKQYPDLPEPPAPVSGDGQSP
jgi:hypothetical protein